MIKSPDTLFSVESAWSGEARSDFFLSIGQTWYDEELPHQGDSESKLTGFYPFSLYYIHKVPEAKLRALAEASRQLGPIILKSWNLIRTLSSSVLTELGYPEFTHSVIRSDSLEPVCMRLDWCWNEDKNAYKLLEINSQTPGLWWEGTVGNGQVSRHFGHRDPMPESLLHLKKSLLYACEKAAQVLGKPLETCEVFCCSSSVPEELGTMAWISEEVLDFVSSAATSLEDISIIDGDGLYHAPTGTRIDIALFWYPMEWLGGDCDAEGRSLWPALEELLLNKKLAFINFGSAFALQVKSIMTLFYSDIDFLTQRELEIARQWVPKSFLTPLYFFQDYFAKPNLGRLGEDAQIVKIGLYDGNNDSTIHLSNEQNMVYQELLPIPKESLLGGELFAVWSVWLYNINGILTPSGFALRLSSDQITDQFAFWCPIGV